MDQSGGHYADEYEISDSQAHPSQSSFSIGGLMGRVVNLSIRTFAATVAFIINLVSTVAILLLRILASIFDILLIQPATFAMDRGQKIFGAVDWPAVGKGIIGLLVVWMFINSLYGSNGQSSTTERSWLPWKTSRPFSPIDYSQLGGDSSKVLMALDRRLQEMENRLIDMQFSQRRAVDRLDGQTRVIDESTSKLDNIDTALAKTRKAQAEAEQKLRESSSAAVSSLRSEIMNMLAQVSHSDPGMSDDRLRILEQRLMAAEAGVKEAVDVSKHAVKEVVANKGHGSSGGNSVRLWDRFVGTDGKTVTIKSTDGHDVTDLIGSLVDSAVLKWSKDDIAKPDFASYFAGARVVPQLTTQTYKIPSKSYWGNWGIFGSTAGEGRPPVTALHPDIHVGNCWPFKGSDGQIGVMLARSIVITDFTIDHAAKEVAFDVRSAPKKMEVWGLVDGDENIKKVADYHRRREQRYRDLVNAANREGRTPPLPEDPYPSTLPPDAHYLRLAQFTYNVDAVSHIQTFTVPQEIQDLGVDIGVVVLKIKSNWGEPNWTCLYRLRVSGRDMHQEPLSRPEIDEL
jgi:SUN domain-containing protein 1/2